jgi:hypothetical protein
MRPWRDATGRGPDCRRVRSIFVDRPKVQALRRRHTRRPADRPTGGAAVGAIVGGTIGAVIGAQAEQRHGYYLWQVSGYYRYPSGQYAAVDPQLLQLNGHRIRRRAEAPAERVPVVVADYKCGH